MTTSDRRRAKQPPPADDDPRSEKKAEDNMTIWKNSPNDVRGIWTNHGLDRTDYAFDNGWGAVVLYIGRRDGGYWSVAPARWDRGKLSTMCEDLPHNRWERCAKQEADAAIAEIRGWPDAPPIPDNPAADGVLYLVTDVGPFAGPIKAMASYRGKLGLHCCIFSQKVFGIPAGVKAEDVMIARNNAITLPGSRHADKAKQAVVSWDVIGPYLCSGVEHGKRSVPRCFSTGPDFVEVV